MPIRWSFIERFEKKSVLRGYVPHDANGPIGRSGVTIATGVDLGQMNEVELYRLFKYRQPFPEKLFDKLRPYTLLRGRQAMGFLKRYPLTVTQEEADILDREKKNRVLVDLMHYWDSESTTMFDDLPEEVQTVLFSLAWNFGANLPIEYPNTWRAFKESHDRRNWNIAYDWMANFPSKNPQLRERRLAEAEILRPLTTMH